MLYTNDSILYAKLPVGLQVARENVLENNISTKGIMYIHLFKSGNMSHIIEKQADRQREQTVRQEAECKNNITHLQLTTACQVNTSNA